MECNKEEARRAMDIAERKLSGNDYIGAKKFISKAHNLYPKLDGLNQVLIMINVFTSASSGEGGGEADWYGILGVDPLADDETLKRQKKKLALLLHPDKNKFKCAEEATKLVLNAWSLLSDKAKRSAYDQKRKSKQVKQKDNVMKPNPPKPHQPTSSTFWASVRAKATKETQERWKIWLEEKQKEFAAAVARGKANEAQRIFKKLAKRTTTTNSTSEAERLFKKPMSANSTFEAQRQFKHPRTSGDDANSTFEAQRLFKKPIFRY